MTTAVYNSNNIGLGAGILSTSPISVSIDSDARPEEISLFLNLLAASIKEVEAERTKQENASFVGNDISKSAYYLNKYGDEYACCDELGFESSYMGARADFNHIF